MSDDDATAERPNMMRNWLDSAIVACNRKNSRATTTTTTENMKPAKKKPVIVNKKPATKKQENFLNNPLSMNHWCPPSDLLLEPEGAGVVASAPVGDEAYAQALQEEYQNEERRGRSFSSGREKPRGDVERRGRSVSSGGGKQGAGHAASGAVIRNKHTMTKVVKNRKAALKAAIEGETAARSGRCFSTATNKDMVSWTCDGCTFEHTDQRSQFFLACVVCGTERYLASSAVASSSVTSHRPQEFVDVDTATVSTTRPEESATAFEIQDQDDPNAAPSEGEDKSWEPQQPTNVTIATVRNPYAKNARARISGEGNQGARSGEGNQGASGRGEGNQGASGRGEGNQGARHGDSDDGSTNKKPAARSTNKKPAARSTNKKPATKEVIDLFSDTTSSPENDVDFDAFIDGVPESVCDPDKVYVVLNDIPSKKRSDFSEPIVLKYKDFQDGVSKQEVEEYLEYITSQKYIDGKKFIAWVNVKKVLLKNYHQRCDRFSGKETLLLRIHFFFDALKFTLKDVIVSEKLYMYWNAVNHPCRFPLVPILAAILGAEIDVNQKVEERMRDQINLLVRQLSLGKQDDKQENLSYVNMNYQMFLHKNIHASMPGQIYQVFSNLRENNHGEEMVDDFKELVNAIAILLEIDQNDEEERKHFVKLTELMKWCLEMSEFLGRPLTLQRTLFHAFAHAIDFNLKITGAENWKKIMKKADQSGQKPKPKKKKKPTGFIKKSIKKSKNFFQGVGNKLGGNTNARANESHGMIQQQQQQQQPQPCTDNANANANANIEEVDLVNRIFDACVITDNENIANELLENVDKMRSMVDNNNNNNSTRQQKFAGIWSKHTLLNSSKVRKMKRENPLYDKQWDAKFRELCRFQEEHGHTRIPWNDVEYTSLYNWCEKNRESISDSRTYTSTVMTPKRFISLCSIDFVWEPYLLIWYDTYDKIRKYKKSHGRLPTRTEDRNSYGWIRRNSGLDPSRILIHTLSFEQLQDIIKLLKGDQNYRKGLENVRAEFKKKFGNSLAI